jgi:hypothetical protein
MLFAKFLAIWRRFLAAAVRHADVEEKRPPQAPPPAVASHAAPQALARSRMRRM